MRSFELMELYKIFGPYLKNEENWGVNMRLSKLKRGAPPEVIEAYKKAMKLNIELLKECGRY